MRVKLVSFTAYADWLVAQAARVCYSAKDIENFYMDEYEVQRMIKMILDNGHTSVLEHASFTFYVSGISRASANQLQRHRIASYSQQSQRYVKGVMPLVCPDSVAGNEAASRIWEETESIISSGYNLLLDIGIPAEDARGVLGMNSETRLMFTMNARSLLNFFELRCCSHAQHEIRELANTMLKLVKEVAPNIFKQAGAKCATCNVKCKGELQ